MIQQENDNTPDEVQQSNEEVVDTVIESPESTNNDLPNTETLTDRLILRFTTTEKNSGSYEHQREHVWNLDNQLDLSTFLNETKYNFEEGGYIEPRNDEEGKPIEQRIGYKIIQTTDKDNLVYLCTIKDNNTEKILKGGKVKGTLTSRSYTAGTQHNWTMNGSPSPTNYIYSQIFRHCMRNDIEVKFYVYQAPTIKVPYPMSNGDTGYVEISPYEEMEKTLNAHLVQVLGRKPVGEGDLEALYKE